MTIRNIKVLRMSYNRTIKDKYHSAFDQHVEIPVPWVQMKGKWLEKAGFAIDTKIKVRVMKGCLVLTAQAQKAE